ncbi:hypothetical protein Tco_0459023, partial [Tanacetum coccineum]
QELLYKLLQDLKSINEELAEYNNTPSCNLPTSSYDDDDDEYSFTTQEYLMTCSTAITPDSPKTDSLIMVDKHLDTIPETESDEFIKSSVENLFPTPSELEDFSDIESECDVLVCDNLTNFSNPLFDANDDDASSDEEEFKISSNPLFDLDEVSPIDDEIDFLLDEFFGELTRLQSIPPGIDNINLDPEGDILFLESLLYDNFSPRPPKAFQDNSNTIIESLPTFPIPVKDSDSLREV